MTAGLPRQTYVLVGGGSPPCRRQRLAADGEHGKVGTVPANSQELGTVQGQLEQAWCTEGWRREPEQGVTVYALGAESKGSWARTPCNVPRQAVP